MRERPSDDMIDERLAAWQAGDYPEGCVCVRRARMEPRRVHAWLADRSASRNVPCRPCPILKFMLPWRGIKRELSWRNLLNAGTSVSAVARSMGISRATVHRAMERTVEAAE